MKATIYISGVIGKETTLTDVIRQYKSYEDPDEIQAVIHSEGGNVEDGNAIYNYLKTLDLEVPVTTVTDKAYSIASKIFAAGSTRIIEDVDEAIMIHFAWANKVSGKAEKLELIAEALREIEEEFTSFYAELLDIDEETAKALLDNDTFLSGEEAVELGLATELKTATKAVAIYKDVINVKTKKMTKKIKKSKTQALVDAFAAFLKPENETEVVALVLQDSNGVDIDFAELESGDTPKVGDKGTIEDSPVKDGDYIIPSMDEATVTFVDGAITEIKPKEDDEEGGEETEEEIQARLAAEAANDKPDINAEEIKEVFTYSVTATNTSFEVGDVIMFEGWDGGEDYAASSGEFKLKDGRSVVTDAAGVIVKIKAADSEEQIIDTEAKEAEAKVEAMFEKAEAKIEEKFQAKFDKQESEIKAMGKLIGSKEFKAEEIIDENTRTKTGSRNKLAEILSGANKNN